MQRCARGVMRPVVACAVGLMPATALAWGGWWDHDHDVCYLRDDGYDDGHDWLDDLIDHWDKDEDHRIEVDCDYFCEGGCVKDAATWCETLSSGGDWPIPGWAYDGRCGESWLELICSTGTDRFHSLARQYATGLLNFSDGACLPDAVRDDLWEAHEVLRGCNVRPVERPAANRLIVAIGSYNTGKVGPGSCRDHDDCDWWDLDDWLDPECLHAWFDHDWKTCKDPSHDWH